jgi:hypothetical protein
MSKSIIITHISYLTALFIILFFMRNQVLELIIRPYVSEKGAIILNEDVRMLDSDGREVGVLFKGAGLMKPNLDDLIDTDIGDNVRFKLLIDLNIASIKSASQLPEETFFVYSALISEPTSQP